MIDVMFISDQLYSFHQLLSPFFSMIIHAILVSLEGHLLLDQPHVNTIITTTITTITIITITITTTITIILTLNTTC